MIVDDRSGKLSGNDDEMDNLGLGGVFALFRRVSLSALEAAADGVDLFAARVAAFDSAMQSAHEHALLKADLVQHINR